MSSLKQARVLNTYEPPSLKKLRSEEAKQFLLHHANMGDSGAKEILDLVSPERKNSGN
jgi:hypothetical protein